MSFANTGTASSEQGFWANHLVWPTLGLGLSFWVVLQFHLDIHWADAIYAWEGGHWNLREQFITSKLLHGDAQTLVKILGGILLLAGVASLFWTPLKRYRGGFAFLIASITISLLLVALGKHQLPIPCPWSLQRYGGSLPMGDLWLYYQTGPYYHNGCFPSGHASGGYSLLAWYFFARHYRWRHASLYLLPGIAMGLIFGFDQQLRGAHFISDDIAAAATCWLVSLFAYVLMLRPEKSHSDEQ